MKRPTHLSLLKSGIVLTAALATTACGNSRAVRGYVFDTELADAIQPGVDNRTSVESTLGTPTMAATFDPNTWYYVSTTVRVRPVFWPDAQQHRVLVVAFNDRGVVSAVNNLDIDDMLEVDAVADRTPTRAVSKTSSSPFSAQLDDLAVPHQTNSAATRAATLRVARTVRSLIFRQQKKPRQNRGFRFSWLKRYLVRQHRQQQ